MLGGGRDRSELRNFNPKEYADSDDPDVAMGSHKGMYAGLNIINPVPGYVYGWANDDAKSILTGRHKGYEVVDSSSPERAAYEIGTDHTTAGALDSSRTGFPGLVLVRRSAQNERRVRDEEQSLRDDLLRSGDAEKAYLNKATAIELQYGGERLQRNSHRTHITAGPDSNGPIVDSWTPSQGITKG